MSKNGMTCGQWYEKQMLCSNNLRKRRGEPMKRWRQIWKARAKENKSWERRNAEYMKMWFGVDLSEGHDFSIDISDRYYPIYGQPVINQKAVVKIVTSGEE